MGKMVRAVLFAVMAVFSTAVFAGDVDPCAMPANLTEIEGAYQIGTCGDLYKFAEMVNGGETGINGRLTADICVNACGEGESVLKADGSLNGDGSNFKPWTPILGYDGTFDGNGYTISGLYFNNGSADFVGLFRDIGENTKVQNVGVEDSYFRGKSVVGGVVGLNAGGTISNVYNTGAVSGTDGRVGGVVGWNIGGTVSNVYNTGAVSGLFNVGGVVGYNEGTVSNVYNIGAVSSEDWFVGGVVGDNGGTVSNAYYNIDMPCTRCGSPIEGTNGKTTAELAALDVALAFESSDGVWVAGYDSISNGWRKYAFPSLKGVGTAPTFIELDPNATEVEISNVEELLKFAELVNAGNTTLNAKLTADIVVNEGVLKADGTLNGDGSNFTQWTPIGMPLTPYEGTFDGNGKRISGLYFNNEGASYVGLFGFIGSGSKVQNVGVVDSYIRGWTFVGGVVGLNAGGTISNVYNTGAVSGEDDVGGVVGRLNARGTVSNVYNTGSVNGTGDYVGGVAGTNGGTISNVYNTGAVSGYSNVGGVAGTNGGTIRSNVYNTGAVSGYSNVGGVVGYNEEEGFIDFAYYNTDFYTGNAIGENANEAKVSHVEGKTTAELIAIDLGPEWVAGNLAYDKKTGKLTASFPYLENLADFQYKITALEFKVVDNVIQIANADDLKDFARLVSEFGVTDVDVKLTADIVVNENVLNDDGTLNVADTSKFIKWTPIGTDANSFAGTFDGDDKTISGLYFNDESGFGGLFGILEEATVKNVGVVDSYFSGQSAIGAIAGLVADGEVSNVYSESAVSGGEYVGGVVGVNVGIISGSYNKGSVNGHEKVGGIVGADVGKITDCYNMGSVKGFLDIGGVAGLVEGGGEVDKVYNMGAVSGEEFLAGGLIGSIDEGSLKIGYNTGAVSGKNSVGGVVGGSADASIDNVYNTGAVSGENAIGGIVGGNEGGIISNVLNMGSVIGTEDVGGIVGGMGNNSISNCYFDKTIFDGNAIGEKYGEEIDESNFGKTSDELVAGTSLKLDTAAWVVGGVGVGTTNDSLYYPYLKVFGPHEYVLGDVKKYAITVAVNDKAMGTVTGAGEYEYGTEVEIKAVANEGYKFTDWEDDVNTAARMITVTKAETYTANFEAISSSSSSAKSSSSSAKSSSSEAKSSSSDAKSSSSQKESIIAQAQLPQFSVTASGKMVSIAGARPNSIVNVFDMQGNMVKTVVATAANFTFALPSAGVYIVKNGYTAKRVNVR